MRWYHRTSPWAADAILAGGFSAASAGVGRKGFWIADYVDEAYGYDNKLRDGLFAVVHLAVELPDEFPFLMEDFVIGPGEGSWAVLAGRHRIVAEDVLNGHMPFRVVHTQYDGWPAEEFRDAVESDRRKNRPEQAALWQRVWDFMIKHDRLGPSE